MQLTVLTIDANRTTTQIIFKSLQFVRLSFNVRLVIFNGDIFPIINLFLGLGDVIYLFVNYVNYM